MIEEKANNEYSKLTLDDRVQGIVNNLQFRKKFLEEFSKYPDLKVEVTFDSKVVLSREGVYPEATNGIYKGVKDYNKIVFSLEQAWGDEYLTVLHDSAMICVMPSEPTFDIGSCSKQIEVYDDNGRVAVGNVYTSETPIKNLSSASVLLSGIPSLSVQSVLNHAAFIPEDGGRMKNYQISSAARLKEMPGVVVQESKKYEIKGNVTSVENELGYYSVETEYPNEMRFASKFAFSRSKSSSNGVQEDMPMQVLMNKDGRDLTLEEAMQYVQFNYEQNISEGRYKSL